MQSLLYNIMDEFLYIFCTEYFIVRQVRITALDLDKFSCTAIGSGEEWDPKKHPQGTEVKAITYSNMQIISTDEKTDIYVIIDI